MQKADWQLHTFTSCKMPNLHSQIGMPVLNSSVRISWRQLKQHGQEFPLPLKCDELGLPSHVFHFYRHDRLPRAWTHTVCTTRRYSTYQQHAHGIVNAMMLLPETFQMPKVTRQYVHLQCVSEGTQ
jgi:hypothetical protein